MAYIWRVETNEGEGAYMSGAAGHALDEAADYAGNPKGRHPAPSYDARLADWWEGSYGDHSKWRFGFATLDQYRNWFFTSDIRRRLAQHHSGVKLRKYRVPADDFKAGMNQAVFRRERAVLVEERACDFC